MKACVKDKAPARSAEAGAGEARKWRSRGSADVGGAGVGFPRCPACSQNEKDRGDPPPTHEVQEIHHGFHGSEDTLFIDLVKHLASLSRPMKNQKTPFVLEGVLWCPGRESNPHALTGNKF